MIKGETRQLCPDDHVTLLKRDNSIDSRPEIGFRIIMVPKGKSDINPYERPSEQDCFQHPWLSVEMARTNRVQPSFPSTEIMVSPSSAVREAPRPPSGDSDDASPPSSSSIMSSDGDEEVSISAPKFPSYSSSVSDRMDVCSVRSGESDSAIKRASPMGIDTMKPSSKVWCILYPLPGNVVGKTTLFLTKPTTTVGSDTSRDVVLRHHKISDQHCAIMSGDWDKERGLMGIIIHVNQGLREFRHRSTIYILAGQNGTLPFLKDADLARTYRIYCEVPWLR